MATDAMVLLTVELMVKVTSGQDDEPPPPVPPPPVPPVPPPTQVPAWQV